MKIGLMGFDFQSPNMGCEALSYSFVNMLSEIVPDNLELVTFGYSPLGKFPEYYPNIKFTHRRVKMKNPLYWLQLKKEFSQCKCVFDITYGDGFSDIYGKMWNINTDIQKQIANMSSTPLILLPQTYGPYKSRFLKNWAAHIIKKSHLCFSRDGLSAENMKKCGCNNINIATDLAFALPFDKSLYNFSYDKLKIGINVSSLLWNEWSSNIELKTDYKDYIRQIITYCTELTDSEVHLIAHVIDSNNSDSQENDFSVCKMLHNDFPNTVLAPKFDNPIYAKSYISNMDVFIGARMHATIGAISSGVATVPFSYSRKFEGLFNSLNYPYVISATKISTEDAVNCTKEYIKNRDKLKADGNSSIKKTTAILNSVKQAVANIINGK